MEREGKATAAGNVSSCWDTSPDGVIVLPAGSAVVRPQMQFPQHRVAAARLHPQQREKEEHQPTAGAELFVPEPPEKVFYKTRLCEKFEAGGRCAYKDGCTFAHGHAELRPPLPLPVGTRRSRMAPPPTDAVVDGGGRTGFPFHYFGAGKVCFEFRDKGTCHFGDKCNYAHALAAVQPADMLYPKLPEQVRRSATPPARAFSPGSGSVNAPAVARAFPPGSDAAGQGEGKPTRLELLSRKKLSGIYGDWPEEF